jgi:hypothetical protein
MRSSSAGAIGRTDSMGGGLEDMIAVMRDAWLDPVKAFLPVAIS